MAKIFGVVAILSSPTGNVFTASCFEQSAPGGMKLDVAQRHDARNALAHEMIKQSCSTWISEVIDTYRATEIMNDLINRKGWKLEYHNVEIYL